MTHSAWIALAFGLAGLAIQAAIFAYMQGRLSQRVATLERDGSALQEIRDSVTRLTVQMESLHPTVDRMAQDVHSLQRQIANLATDRASKAIELPATPRRRRGSNNN